MKNLLLFLISITLVNCSSKTEKKNISLIGMEFKEAKQVEKLFNYTKVSDTVFYENASDFEAKHGILHLNNVINNLIIFKSILYYVNNNRSFKILDTLIITKLDGSEFVTIGYCENKMNNNNFIALVDKTDSLEIQKINKIWLANVSSEKIELVNNMDNITCINEWFIDINKN
ncbi:hypothetical protein EV196_102598 [Mariniflexile fucanivorans]|uniref:Uncharacterized protein n=1 Tax=Mariniflexile fucanivorans TaxID=264023 RepID=A0A4R1RP70_9FLAO|nr:hypothetical protein [Mariniflexile fucanivorans]TCL68034.1 hypothetical protein EV196_102598 [Mariniflexile fucanivorans]